MAKQLGIHQIKGKVGQRSYYRTKGVVDGISRSINQGLSARVKTAEEYANTRLNNAEFKNANAIATAAFRSVLNRNRGMIVNFAIAAMTKNILEDIKQGTGAWGARHPYTELDRLICDSLENHAKAQIGMGAEIEFTTSGLNSSGEVENTITISKEAQLAFMALGIDGVQIVSSKCLAGEVDVDDVPRLFAGHATAVAAPIVFTGNSDITATFTDSYATPSSVGMSQSGYTFAQTDPKHGFYNIATLLAFRQVGANRYIMQEYCTFNCVPLGQIPD